MSGDTLHTLLASRRRPSIGESERRTFSLARAEALGRLRNRHGLQRWGWVSTLARSVLSLTPYSDLRFQVARHGVLRSTRLCFAFDPATLWSMSPLPLLDVALEPVGAAVRSRADERLTRAQRLLGRAVNEALALGPSALRVRTPTHQHTFSLAAVHPTMLDYEEHIAVVTTASPHALEFEITLRSINEGLERLAGDDGAFESLKVLNRTVPGATVEAYGGVLRTMPDLPHVRLGATPTARYWPTPRERGLRLLVDGVLMGADLDAAMREHGVDVSVLAGIIDAPGLALTFDERSVVPDPASTLLAAWLHDLVARGVRWPIADPRVAGGQRRAIVDCQWPHALVRVQAADGRTYDLSDMGRAAAAGIPAVVAWPHEAAAVPLRWRAQTLVMWPSDLELLRRELPQLPIVPASEVRLDEASARGDWTALAEASLPMLTLGRTVAETEPLQQLDVSVFIHRAGMTTNGTAVLLRAGVRCAFDDAPGRTIPGVAILVHARDDTPAQLLPPDTPSPRTRALIEHAHRFVRGRVHELVAHACAHATTAAQVERCTFLRSELAALTAADVGLHREGGPAGALRWNEHPLLACVIGHRHDGGALTLASALEWARSAAALAPELARACVPSALGQSVWSQLFGALPFAPPVDAPAPTGAPPRGLDAARPVVAASAPTPPVREVATFRVDLTDADLLGHLDVVLEGDSAGVTISIDGVSLITTVLPSPFAALRGELALRERDDANPEALQRLLLQCGWRSCRLAAQAMVRTNPSSPRHAALRQFVVAARPHVPTAEPPLEPGSVSRSTHPELAVDALEQLCAAALGQALRLERRTFSWAAVARRGDRLQIGARHAWIGAALRRGATPQQLRLAAMLIVAKLLARSSASAGRIADALARAARAASVA